MRYCDYCGEPAGAEPTKHLATDPGGGSEVVLCNLHEKMGEVRDTGCVFCRRETSGKYHLTHYGIEYTPVDKPLCKECRHQIVFAEVER
jgi:hypothetical protein